MMRIRTCRGLPLLLCVVLLSGFATPNRGRAQSRHKRDLESVRKVVTDIIQANNSGDINLVRRLYADDAVWLPPAGLPVKGKTAILARYQESFANFNLAYSLQSEETQLFGDWAFDRGFTKGRLTPKDGGQPRETYDKYLMILHKNEKGEWQIARLMWNPVGEKP